MKEKMKVVITDLSNCSYYYQWFIYGLMLLDKSGQIDLQFKVNPVQRLSLMRGLCVISKAFTKFYSIVNKKLSRAEPKMKNLFRGYAIEGNEKRFFCIDSADAPFMYSSKELKECDVYFKMQCPKEFREEGFYLGDICIPYIDYEYVNSGDKYKIKAQRKNCNEVNANLNKIKPLLVAVRKLSIGNDFKSLDTGYQNLVSSRSVSHVQKAMCYFGSSKGPKPSPYTDKPDFDWEADILSYFGDRINHPNEKRAKIAEILKSLGEGYDARIINRGFSDINSKPDASRIISLKDFSKHVAKFEYNVNVSGYRMSIPNRFMDSFVCGTAIATDNLSVKWYQPFDDEVVEIGPMGYYCDDEVDYNAIKECLKNLPTVSKKHVIDKYEKYWAPEKCAKYIVETIRSI